MEVRASTYSASKLGALAVGQSQVRHTWGRVWGRGGHIRFKVTHDGIEERKRRRCGTEVWVGLSEDMDLEGSLYSQGECGLHSFGGRGDYRNEFLNRGGARAIRWSIRRNPSGHTTASELPSSCNIFRDARNLHTVRQIRSEKCLQSTYAHVSVKIIVGQFIVVSYPSWLILCRSATDSVARDGTPPCPPHHFRAPLPRAPALWPLDVLSSHYPFKNTPLPVLQGLSRQLFHLPSQIRTR